jgi:predicted nuclease of predicted toxin-antitoxin system
MRFIVDANLPRFLSQWISKKGHVSEHALDIGLAKADDRAIWSYATSQVAVIVSKDQDFADLAMRTDSGPCVIWLRTGNGTTKDLLHFLEPVWQKIETRLIAGERLIQIR